MAQDPRDFHPARVQQDYVSDRSAAVLLEGENGRFGIGSSSAIEISGSYFLITAGHVLLPLAQGATLRLAPSGFTSQSLRALSYGFSEDGGRGFPDIAWIELDPASVAAVHIRFLALDDLRIDQSHDASRAFLVQGYPYSEVGQDDLQQLDLLSIGAVTVSRSQEELGLKERDPRSLIVEYPPHDYRSSEFLAPPAQGISGGGVWRIPHLSDGPVWDPSQARLVAVNREWNRKEGLLHATPVRYWLDLVAQAKPGLRQAIQARIESGP